MQVTALPKNKAVFQNTQPRCQVSRAARSAISPVLMLCRPASLGTFPGGCHVSPEKRRPDKLCVLPLGARPGPAEGEPGAGVAVVDQHVLPLDQLRPQQLLQRALVGVLEKKVLIRCLKQKVLIRCLKVLIRCLKVLIRCLKVLIRCLKKVLIRGQFHQNKSPVALIFFQNKLTTVLTNLQNLRQSKTN